jgi:hypothetical protein
MDRKFLVGPGLIFDLFYHCYLAEFFFKCLRPVCSFAVIPPKHTAQYKFQD